jgi:protein lifeguard
MAANTKYTAVAQRDSLDDTAHYSQAPPSYVDEPSSSAADDAALLGSPRNSDDNIPDDFKVCGVFYTVLLMVLTMF